MSSSLCVNICLCALHACSLLSSNPHGMADALTRTAVDSGTLWGSHNAALSTSQNTASSTTHNTASSTSRQTPPASPHYTSLFSCHNVLPAATHNGIAARRGLQRMLSQQPKRPRAVLRVAAGCSNGGAGMAY